MANGCPDFPGNGAAMRDLTILKANLKRHKGGLAGIFILMAITVAALAVVLTVHSNTKSHVQIEMRRIGFGDLTVWVSGDFNLDSLVGAIKAVDPVASVGTRQIIYANYELLGHESDSEGQLITYGPGKAGYRFFFQ